MSSIAGVAIAVALVPPLAVSGIGLALGRKATAEAGLHLSQFGLYTGADIAGGAFLLFLTNFIGIVLVAILVFLFQHYGDWKKALLALVVMLGLSGLVIRPLNQELRDLYVESRVMRLIAKLAVERPDIVTGRVKVHSLDVKRRNGLLHVYIGAFFPKDVYGEQPGALSFRKRPDLFRAYLSEDLGEPVQVDFEIMLVDMSRYSSKPTALPADGKQGTDEK